MEATGKGTAWGNSLFEDNAEYGLGQAVPPNLSSGSVQRSLGRVQRVLFDFFRHGTYH